jgi:hypothetical protein
MYSPNFRSFVRTLLRQEAENWEGPLEPAAISKRVVENILVDFEHSNEDWCETAYQLVYDEACKLFKKEKKEIPLQLNFLVALGVPQEHAQLILQLDQARLYVPSKGGYMDLAGDERMTRAQLEEANKHLRGKKNELGAKNKIIRHLISLPGYYV